MFISQVILWGIFGILKTSECTRFPVNLHKEFNLLHLLQHFFCVCVSQKLLSLVLKGICIKTVSCVLLSSLLLPFTVFPFPHHAYLRRSFFLTFLSTFLPFSSSGSVLSVLPIYLPIYLPVYLSTLTFFFFISSFVCTFLPLPLLSLNCFFT